MQDEEQREWDSWYKLKTQLDEHIKLRRNFGQENQELNCKKGDKNTTYFHAATA